MKRIFLTVIFVFSVFALVQLKAQSMGIPELPEGKEAFIKSENDFIKLAKWLETTQVNTSTNERIKVNALVVAWITNSPTVTVEVRSSILKAFDKNAQLLPVFLAGYSRYCLENNYSKDEVKCNTAGLKAVIDCYNLGGELKKDKAIEKIIEKDKENKLEEWVKEAMTKK